MAASCHLYNMKKMDCQIGEQGNCAICVKLPCMGSGNCADVKIECCKPSELEECCKNKGKGNECCVCVLCEDGKLAKVIIECCGKRQEMVPATGNAVCICVPQKGNGKCGGQVQVKECGREQMEKCCTQNTADGECCCICVQCHEGNCQALVCCPSQASGSATGTGTCCSTTDVPCC